MNRKLQADEIVLGVYIISGVSNDWILNIFTIFFTAIINTAKC